MTSSRMLNRFVLNAAVVLVASCSSSSQVDLNESKRFLGRENDVRVDAQLFSDQIDNTSFVRVVYEVGNFRSNAIALALANTETDYDPATRTITLNIGCEIPGDAIVPHLTKIESSERKTFSVGAKVNVLVPTAAGPFANRPLYLRVKLHFLGEVEPFTTLLTIPDRGVHDPQLADQLFFVWIEKKETVVTNTLPIRWGPDSLATSARFGGSF